MQTLTLKSKSYQTIWLEMVSKIQEGWKESKPLEKNFWGNWVVTLTKK